jgi:hypothetical protein
MPNKTDTNKYHYRIGFRINNNLKELLELRSKEEHLSKNKLLEKALTLYLTKDIEDESLVVAKLTQLQRQIEYMEKKIDIGQKKDIQWEQFLLTVQAELPADKTTRDLKIKRATQRYGQFLMQFRNRARTLPTMLESVLADMQEHTPVKQQTAAPKQDKNDGQ